MMITKSLNFFSGLTKKALLISLSAVAAAFLLFQFSFADSAALSADRALSLYNIHNQERIEIEYCSDGEYVPDALTAIGRILRDPLNGEVKPIDPKLLDLLFVLQAKVGSTDPFTIICGYRSPQTNATLRARSRAVAEHSLHMEGKAVDIRLSGVPLRTLYKAALELKAGGVGYYPKSDFIHVDVGPVRTW